MLRAIYVAVALLVMAVTAATGVNDGVPTRDLGGVRIRNRLDIPVTFAVGQLDLVAGDPFYDPDYCGTVTLAPGRAGWFRDETGRRRILRRDLDWTVFTQLEIEGVLVDHYCELQRALDREGLPRRQPRTRRLTRERFTLCFE